MSWKRFRLFLGQCVGLNRILAESVPVEDVLLLQVEESPALQLPGHSGKVRYLNISNIWVRLGI